MMMTSTYPGSRYNHNMNHGLKEIQSKKEALISLETALKKRVSELKELCLKEGELTGHLPIDYPLQPREPIPQIRRRVNQSSGSRSCSRTSSNSSISNNNLNGTNNLAPPGTSIRSHPTKIDSMQSQQQVVFAIPTNNTLPTANLGFPSRPTSTNSTSSSISTASSNTRSAQNAIVNPQQQLHLSSNLSNRNPSTLTQTNVQVPNNNTPCFTSNNSHYTDPVVHNQLNNHRPIRYDQSMLPNHFKRPFNIAPTATFDSDTFGQMRASSTASSSSSSGSGTSSVLSAPPAVPNSTPLSNGLNLHGRSCSESITSDFTINSLSSNMHSRPRSQHLLTNQMAYLHTNPNVPPARPPRGPPSQGDRRIPSSTDTVDGNLSKQQQPPPTSENRSNLVNTHQHQKDVKPLQHFNMNGLTNFQPFLEEETKPFQMSDFYKYSSKYRQKVSDPQKTTRQLQEDVSKKNSLKYSSCGDQSHGAIPKLFEKSGQKLIEATAKAIAGNPGLAEKLDNILPKNHKSDNRY